MLVKRCSKELFKKCTLQLHCRATHYDVLIVGGGVMGSSTAYFLKSKEPSLNIGVIERDSTVSQQFTEAVERYFSVKILLWNILQTLQKNIRDGVSFLIKLQAMCNTCRVYTRCPANFMNFVRTVFFVEPLRSTASKFSFSQCQKKKLVQKLTVL